MQMNSYSTQQTNGQKGFSALFVFIILILVALGLFFGYKYMANKSLESQVEDLPEYFLSRANEGSSYERYVPTPQHLAEYDIKSYEVPDAEGVSYTSDKNRKELLDEIYRPRQQDGWVAIAGSNTYNDHSVLKMKNRIGETLVYRVEDMEGEGSRIYILGITNTLIKK